MHLQAPISVRLDIHNFERYIADTLGDLGETHFIFGVDKTRRIYSTVHIHRGQISQVKDSSMEIDVAGLGMLSVGGPGYEPMDGSKSIFSPLRVEEEIQNYDGKINLASVCIRKQTINLMLYQT